MVQEAIIFQSKLNQADNIILIFIELVEYSTANHVHVCTVLIGIELTVISYRIRMLVKADASRKIIGLQLVEILKTIGVLPK